MFDVLGWVMGFGGVTTAAILAVCAYVFGAKAVVEALSPIIKKGAEITADVMSSLWDGTKKLFETVSDIFMVVLIIGATWFFTAGHYSNVLRDQKMICQQQLDKKNKKPSGQQEQREWNPFDIFK